VYKAVKKRSPLLEEYLNAVLLKYVDGDLVYYYASLDNHPLLDSLLLFRKSTLRPHLRDVDELRPMANLFAIHLHEKKREGLVLTGVTETIMYEVQLVSRYSQVLEVHENI
jgi:hypothetical protein